MTSVVQNSATHAFGPTNQSECEVKARRMNPCRRTSITTVVAALVGTVSFHILMDHCQMVHAQETSQDDTLNIRDGLVARFNTFDRNKDKKLPEKEFISRFPEQENKIALRDFHLFDADSNESLSLDEFLTVPTIARPPHRGPIPDPLMILVDQAVVAMDKSFNNWDENPEVRIPATTFTYSFCQTFGLNTSQVPTNEADPDGDRFVSRKEARRFLEIQFAVRHSNGVLLREPDGRVCELMNFQYADLNGNMQLERNEFLERLFLKERGPGILKQVDSDQDDIVTFDEWIRVPNRGLLDQVMIFRRTDTNLDGFVDTEELNAAAPAFKKQYTAITLPGFDSDNDNRLSLFEFRLTMPANQLMRWHQPIRDNGDDQLTFAEFTFGSFQFPLLRWIYFQRFDLNADGFLSIDEFPFIRKIPDEFFIVNANGTEWRSLYRFNGHSACGSPAVSPDGRHIAFDGWSMNPRTSPTMFVMDIEGSKPRKLGLGSMPNWSHDGARLACSSRGVRIITDEGDNDTVVRENGWAAQWSPDGKTIAFTESTVIKAYDVKTRTIRTVLKDHDYRRILWNMTWSPDSRRLCFKGQKADGTQEVVTVDAFADAPEPKVHHSTKLNVNADFAWHPDGNRIIFGMHCLERQKTQLYEFDPEKEESPTLFPGQDETRNNTDVCWTPDGKQLIVVSGDF